MENFNENHCFLGNRFLSKLSFVCLLLIALSGTAGAQHFQSYGGLIPNNTTGNCFSMSVAGIGNLSSTNGIVRVCLSIDQARPNDMDIFLQSPDGTVIELSSDNGGSSGNDYYQGLCFSDCGPSNSITSGSNFRGVYAPEQALSGINNGNSGNGTWQLCINDDNVSGTDGILNFWALDFGTTTPPTSPTGETCATAFALTSMPYSHTCMTLAGSVDNYSACSSNMEGADYLFSYTPASANEYLSVDAAQDFSAPSGFPTISLLDTCPDLAVAANCIQTEIQFSSTENILHITSVPLTQGKTYYIVVASSSGTGGDYDIRIDVGRNGNDDCFQATVIDHEGEYAGNNYNATIPNLQAPNTTEMSCNGSIDNFVYYTFTTDATGSTVNVSLTDIDCSLSCGGSCGIQIALFEAPVGGPCLGPGTWGAPVYCESSTETNVYYSWSGLSPNTQYYIMVDGNAGSQCVWNLYAAGDFQQVSLPVTMNQLEVQAQQGQNQLNWKTYSEVNAKSFEIEHAQILPQFESLGQVNAAGNSETELNYQFGHTNPEKGWHYYRLKMVDLDGSVHYSNIANVLVEEVSTFKLYPNPAKTQLNIQSSSFETVQVRIIGTDGRLWMEKRYAVKDNESLQLQIEQLPAGLYFIEVQADGEFAQTQKFTKL